MDSPASVRCTEASPPGSAGRETLLPLLVLPVVAPVLIGATRAVESALGTDGVALSEGWPWIGLLAVFAVAFGVGGALAFGPLIEEVDLTHRRDDARPRRPR